MSAALFGNTCGIGAASRYTGAEHLAADVDRREVCGTGGAAGGTLGRAAAPPAGFSGTYVSAERAIDGGVDDGYVSDDNTAVAEVTRGFQYDCNAYRAAFGDMPVHLAVTPMFGE